MATYIYRFQDTGETIEVQQSMKDEPFTEIDGRPVHRVITGGSGVILKGGGWTSKGSFGPFLSEDDKIDSPARDNFGGGVN